MARIELFDGTRDQKFGRALVNALQEHAKYQKMQIRPTPGEIDIQGFSIVNLAERMAYNPQRGQVYYTKLLDGVLNGSEARTLGKNTITLSEKDLYTDRTGWCFGCVSVDERGGQHLAMSTYRIPNRETFVHIATHELGHMLGAAREGRKNTVENFGSHCINKCVMEQRLSIPEMINHAKSLRNQSDKFCYQCQSELRSSR